MRFMLIYRPGKETDSNHPRGSKEIAEYAAIGEMTGAMMKSGVIVETGGLTRSSRGAFTLEPQGAATRVTWSTSGTYKFGAKVFGVFVNLDNLVGRDFESGLANLMALAEG